ncbi:MAG: PAS domain-containing protein [Alphaproteobacteria bacterium]|nr:PAS domain-containing protein [Alphaproteobacteria bacterium]
MSDPTFNLLKRRLRGVGAAPRDGVPPYAAPEPAPAEQPAPPTAEAVALLEALPGGVMVLDPAHRLEAVNSRLCSLVGLERGFFQPGETFASLARRASLQGERCLLGLGELLDQDAASGANAEPKIVTVVNEAGVPLTVQSSRRGDGGSVLSFSPPAGQFGRARPMIAEEAIDNIPGGVIRCVLAPEGTSICVYASRNADQVFGIQGEALVAAATDVLGYFDSESRGRLTAAIRESAVDGTPFDLILSMSDAQDCEHWVRCTGRAGLDRSGRVVWDGRVFLCDDRVRAERERERLQLLLDNIVENVPYMVTVRDVSDMTYRIINRAAEEQIGAPRETMIGRTKGRLFGEHGSDKQPERTRELLETGHAVDMPEVVIDTPAKGRRHFLGRKVPLFDQDGAIRHILTVTQDITAQRESENALRRSEQRLREAIESFTDGLALFDADDRLVLCNRRYLNMWSAGSNDIRPGVTYEEIVRLILGKGVLDKEVPDIDGYVAARVNRHRNPPVTSEHRLASGRWLHVTHRATGEGGVSITCTDITALKEREEGLRRSGMEAVRAKEAAEAASRSKSDFLANMSHELRTPLNAVIGFSEIIKDALLGEDRLNDYREYARDIHESGKHLLELINDILDMSKIEAGKLELFEETLHIEQVIEPCLKLVRERATNSGVMLKTELQEQLPMLRADIRKLKQILINLLSNSVKFTPKGGLVTVAAFVAANGEFVLRVSDTGAGIRPEDIERALEPFGQVETGLARSHEGTGLGLTLTKALTELHGGRLDIDTRWKTAPTGTTVSAILPASRIRTNA